jgi:hypothetical protein
MLLKLYLAALAAPEELRRVAVAADTRERAVLDGIAANRRHLADVREALAVLNMVEAMHRAYVTSLRPLAGRPRR